jgi:hypothetical protein
MTDNIISINPQNKSFVKNTEEVDINSIGWMDYNDNICLQCGQDHSHKLKAGNTSLDMISLFLDKEI